MDPILTIKPRPSRSAATEDAFRALVDRLEPLAPSFVASLHADGGSVDFHGVLKRYPTSAALIQACAEFSQCDHLGLSLAQAWQIPGVREAGIEASGASLLRDMLGEVRRELCLHDHGQMLQISSVDTARLSYVITDHSIESGAVLADLEIALACRVLSRVFGPQWTPDVVELPRRDPRDSRPYRRVFNCPISFNASVASVHFDVRLLSRATTLQLCRGRSGQEARLADPCALALDDRVARELSLKIALGEAASADRIAELLGMGGRTLQRQLDHAQTNFRSLSDCVRFGIARRLLRDTDIDLTEMALSLGYSDVSVLTRAFTRWAGTCPSSWRAGRLGAERAVPEGS